MSTQLHDAHTHTPPPTPTPHTHKHMHTDMCMHTHYKCITNGGLVEKEEMTNRYAQEKRWVFSFDLKE